MSILYEIWNKGICGILDIEFFSNFKRSIIPTRFAILGGFNTIFDPKCKSEGQNRETRTSTKVTQVYKEISFKIAKCPPSTYAQSTLFLCKCKEHNFFHPRCA